MLQRTGPYVAKQRDNMWNVLNHNTPNNGGGDPQNMKAQSQRYDLGNLGAGLGGGSSANYQSIQQQRSQNDVLPPITRNRSSVDIMNNRSYTSEPQNERLIGNLNIQKLKLQFMKSQFQTHLLIKQNRPLINTLTTGTTQISSSMPSLENDFGQSLKLPYIQQGASRQELSEVTLKCRELEINLLDLKSSIDRRMAQIIEEIPSRLQRELKSIEGRDSHLWKENNSKLTTLIETVSQIRNQTKQKQQEVNERLSQMQTMVTDNDYKINSLNKQVESLYNMLPSGPPSGGMNIDNTYKMAGSQLIMGGSLDMQSNLNKFERDGEIKFLKDMIAEERQKREH